MNAPKHVDIAIIGAGTAGLTARQEVARHTDNYVIIDPGPLGTTCARVACMPSKALIHAANVYHQLVNAPKGVNTGQPPKPDLVEVMQHVRTLRDDFVAGVVQGMKAWQETHLIRKHARFLDPHTLDLEGQRLTADRFIITTGSVPLIPEPWQPFSEHLLDTNSFYELTAPPARLAIIGLGPVGIELAQALHQLGVEITGINTSRNIGGLTDPEIQNYAIEYFLKNMKMDLHFASANIQEADASRISISVGEQIVHADQALVATGRRPALQNLGLENLDLYLDKHGLPEFDPATLKIAKLPIFLAGDVNRQRPLQHEAADEGRIAGYNAAQSSPHCFIRRTPLVITFTSPNIALVGQTYRELQARENTFVTGRVSFENQGRARIMGANAGLLKIYADKHNGRLLGAELFAPGGEHLAHLLGWAISFDKTLAELLVMPYYHPVLEEGLRSAISDAAKQLELSTGDSRTGYTQIMRCDDNPVS